MKAHLQIRLHIIVSLIIIGAPHYLLAFSGEQKKAGRVIQPEFVDSIRYSINILPQRELKRPKVGLVLSGGGARGIAAVGVLKMFEKNHIPIDFIVGTSMGSIVGGLYAAGYSVDQLEKLAKETDWNDLLAISEETRRRDLFLDQKIAEDKSILVLRFDKFQPILPEAFSTGQRLTDHLNILALQGIYHPDPSFDALRIPFRAVATDLISGKKVVIDRGSLALAMRASMTIPLLFNSVKTDTSLLLDGGLVANIPVDVARECGAELIFAVDVSSPLRPVERLNAPWEIADQIISIMMQSSNQAQLEQADVVMRPLLDNHLSSDFTNFVQLIDAGETSADSAMPIISALISEHYRYSIEQSIGGGQFISKQVVFDREIIGSDWTSQLENVLRHRGFTPYLAKRFVTDLYGTGNFRETKFLVDERDSVVHMELIAIPNPVLKSVSMTGNAVISSDSLMMVFEPILGRRINTKESRSILEKLLGLYRSRGLSLASIRDIRFNDSTGHATISIDEGIIHRMTIRGTSKTKDYVIWRELPFNEKDVFQVSKIAEGLKNIYSTKLFEQVLMTIQEDEDSVHHHLLVINARERHTELVRIGLRLDNERNLQPSIDIRDENFLGIGSELGFLFSGGLRNRYYGGEFKAVRIFDSYLTFSFKGYYSLYDVNLFDRDPKSTPARWNRIRTGEFRESRTGFKSVFGTQLERLGSVTLEQRYETQKIWNIFGNGIDEDEFTVSTIKFSTTIDTQDKYPFPEDGVIMNFSYEAPVFKVKNGIGFTKMRFGYELYNTPVTNHTFRPRIAFGLADETLPITEQFSLGGQHNFYGLREDDSRGRQLLIGGLEYRYNLPIKIFFDSYIKIRYDIGSVWKSAEEVKLKDLRHGVGISLSLDTPIGPAEMSIGKSFHFTKDILERSLSLGPTLLYFTIGY